MTLLNTFSNLTYWSLTWGIVLLVLYGIYFSVLKTNSKQKISMGIAVILLLFTLGSPLDHLLAYNLKSVAMLQHILMLMLIPILFWNGMPKTTTFGIIKGREKLVIVAWFIGAIMMWGGHFIKFDPNEHFGNPAFLVVLFLAGIVFLEPVFHPHQAYRITPLKAVVFLFTSCVSCSILGLWVAFSASAFTNIDMMALTSTLQSPLPMTLKTDQELAGLLMWVPGCVVYATASLIILFRWMEEPSTKKTKPENHAIRLNP